MKGTPLSLRPASTNYYVVKAKQALAAVFPDQTRISGAFKSSAQGAAIALSAIVLTSAFIAFALLLSQKSADLVSILQTGSAVAIGSFGAILLVGDSVTSLPGLGSEVNLGIHSLTIALITLAVVYRVSRKNAKAENLSQEQSFSPIHLAIGFTLMTLGVSYVSQGLATYSIGQIDLQGMSLLSGLFIFAITWATSYTGQVKARTNNSAFSYIWSWITKAIRNFVLIYTALVIFAFIVVSVRNFIEPTYALAQEPLSLGLDLTPDQSLWIFVAAVLYGANLLVQFFFLAMGINVGLDLQGTQGLSELLSTIDPAVLSGASQWTYTLLGPWAYLAVIVVVVIVAFIAGASAADQIGEKFNGVLSYFKALLVGLFISLSVLFISSAQLGAEYSPAEGETVSAGMVWGASVLGVIAFATVLIFLAHNSAGKSFDFFASAYPKIVLAKRNSGLNGHKVRGARAFGLVSLAALLLVAATPITASSINRVSALVDGPIQVGDSVSQTLKTASIKELKTFLNPKNLRKHPWLQSKVLEAAQPSEGYNSKVIVLNNLDKFWEPGNLDATIVIELEKDGKTISKTFETTSTVETNGLLTHVKYEPVIAPTTVKVNLSKFLKNQKGLEITLNGVKVKPGTYFAIPGVYNAKAAGYKLVAATESTIYVENESQLVKIGYEIELPKGGSAKLNSGIQSKASKCLKVSSSGSGDCVSKKDIVGKSVVASSEAEPKEYFDYRDYNFSSGKVSCDVEKRKDALVTAKVAEATNTCATEVTFSRDYYKTAKQLVPKYTTKEVCKAGYVSYDGDLIVGQEYDYWDDQYYYVDIYGSYWSDYEIDYDSCATTQYESVRDGNTTKLIRGSKISTLKMSSSVSKKITVKGTLLDNGEFQVKP